MHVFCPHCGNQLVNDGSLAGQLVACSTCMQQFVMPGGQPQPVAFQPSYSPPSYSREYRPSYRPPPKNSGLAAVLSFFWTGLGNIYNGSVFKGIMFTLIQAVLITGAVATGCLLFPFALLFWVFGIYSAYSEAERINRRYR